MKKQVREFYQNESGATAIEYGLIASLIFLVIVMSVKAMMGGQSVQYAKIEMAVDEAVSP